MYMYVHASQLLCNLPGMATSEMLTPAVSFIVRTMFRRKFETCQNTPELKSPASVRTIDKPVHPSRSSALRHTRHASGPFAREIALKGRGI